MNYYLVEYESKYVWHDEERIKAERITNVVNHVKLNLDFMKKNYLDSDEFREDFRKVYNRYLTLTLYTDKEGGGLLIDKGIKDKRYKAVGKFIEVQGKAKDVDNDNGVIRVYIYRLTNEDLVKMMESKFQQVDKEGYTE